MELKKKMSFFLIKKKKKKKKKKKSIFSKIFNLQSSLFCPESLANVGGLL
jgi:hypothetical protein